MQDKLQGIENTPSGTERRACPRLRVTSLMYIDIGDVNGGIVTSLSENGLALAAGATLGSAGSGDGPLRMRIQFPGISEALEASGEIVWTSSSGKEARVRFVEIAEEAREQIRKWISDQASANEPRPEPAKLPKMQLTSSRRARPRGPRFSFADVASSRVDAQGQAGVEDFSEFAADPGSLPPLQMGGVGFCDGSEAVASAFESPAFAEDRTGRSLSPAHEQAAQTASEPGRQRLPALSIPERRQHSRRQILLFTYAVLGEDNGGLVFNLSEGGLALTAAARLQEHHFSKIRVRFPDSEDWIETSGRLAWKSDSGKEAGIEFLNLSEDTRARIREWALQEEPAAETASKGNDVRTGQSGVQELPSLMEPELSPAEPNEAAASFEEQPFENQVFEEHRFEERTKTPAAPSSVLFKTDLKGILEGASVRRRVAKIKPPRFAGYSAKPRTRTASKALSIAAGVALAVGGWMLFQRTSLNEASRLIAQNLPKAQPSLELKQAPKIVKTDSGASGATADPPVQPKEDASKNAATQNGISTSALQQIERAPISKASKTAATSPNSGSERISKGEPPSKKTLGPVRAPSSAPSSSEQAQRPSPSQHEQEKKSEQVAAQAPAPSSENKLVENKPPEAKPLESKPVQATQAFSAQNKELNATSSSLSGNNSQPAAAPPVDLEKEKPLAVSKQPEPLVVARTPVVSVSFDPYPSILMPKTEKSKKSHQGKSLQMGRLLSRVDPIYPEEARQQGVEGTVRVHAIFNREGAAQSVTSEGGPPLLAPAAMNAVRQWRYSQTILGGQAMETEEDVTVLFRLANSGSKN